VLIVKLNEVELRAPRPGELGWLVHRHGVVYAQELGWGEAFEGMVAEIVGRFGQSNDPLQERCWIAARGEVFLGCVFVTRHVQDTAQLRLFIVEPDARGLGVGAMLLKAAIEFARGAGYRKLILWTNAVLAAARRAYERAGFRLVHQEREQKAGLDFEGQIWEIGLDGV
jgi:GNAT superfamily N-acetyltransferase